MPSDEQVLRRLKLRDLHTLKVIADWGSMAKAAAHLAMSQPAVSRAIAEMEHSIGEQLLDRSPVGVQLTPYGEILLKRALVVFDELNQGLQEIEFLADPAVGEVRIGSTEPMTALVATIIQRISSRFPKIVFHVAVHDTLMLHRRLRERDDDLAISRMSNSDQEDDMQTEILFHDPLVVIAGKHNPLTRRRHLSLKDLLDEPWILGTHQGFLGPFIDEAFRSVGLETPKARVVSASTYLRNNLLLAGPFLAILPEAMLRYPKPHPSLRALPIELPTTRRPIGLIALKHRTMSPLANLVRSVARDVAKSMPVAR
ncbi:MAG: LysR family transcriptional regulator [Bradyrhizobium sp.]|nr:LysR family transcriptional regulator [Bradyrhizobium sp.]